MVDPYFAEWGRDQDRGLARLVEEREARERAEWVKVQLAREPQQTAMHKGFNERQLFALMDSLHSNFPTVAPKIVAALEKKHRIHTTWIASADLASSQSRKRQVWAPRPDTPEAFAIWLHETGHVLSGPCPKRPPHRASPSRAC